MRIPIGGSSTNFLASCCFLITIVQFILAALVHYLTRALAVTFKIFRLPIYLQNKATILLTRVSHSTCAVIRTVRVLTSGVHMTRTRLTLVQICNMFAYYIFVATTPHCSCRQLTMTRVPIGGHFVSRIALASIASREVVAAMTLAHVRSGVGAFVYVWIGFDFIQTTRGSDLLIIFSTHPDRRTAKWRFHSCGIHRGKRIRNCRPRR